MASEVYCTLLYNDAYLPGALVLAHALKDYGSTRGLAVLIGPDVGEKAQERLSSVFDHIIPTATISTTQADAPQFQLLDRPNLDRSYTKINVWRLTQFSKIVFLDADTLPVRNIDELFDNNVTPLSAKTPIAGAPDIGWPDIFNSGMFVLTPSKEIFETLARRARAGLSFDGGDQGLLNQFFENKWFRLPFTFNVTPSASYQYTPAYQHFKNTVSVVHFIGQDKPWTYALSGPFQNSSEFEVKWWNIYNKFYDASLNCKPLPSAASGLNPQHDEDHQEQQEQQSQGEDAAGLTESVYQNIASDGFNHSGSSIGHTVEPDILRWDATRFVPPRQSRPEAENLQEAHYDNVWDHPAENDPAYVKYSEFLSSHSHYNPNPTHDVNPLPPHQPVHHEDHHCSHPEHYSHEQHEDHENHETHENHEVEEHVESKHIFPWEETNHNAPERVFPEDYGYNEYQSEYEYEEEVEEDTREYDPDYVPEVEPEPEVPLPPIPGLGEHPVSTVTREFRDYSIGPSNDATAFGDGFQFRQKNAWDSDCGIQRYVDAITHKPNKETPLPVEVKPVAEKAAKDKGGDEEEEEEDDREYDTPDSADKEYEAKQEEEVEEGIEAAEDELEHSKIVQHKMNKENDSGVIMKQEKFDAFSQKLNDHVKSSKKGSSRVSGKRVPLYLPVTPNPIKLREEGGFGGLSEASDNDGLEPDDDNDDNDDDDEEGDYDFLKPRQRRSLQPEEEEEVWDPHKKLEELAQLAALLQSKQAEFEEMVKGQSKNPSRASSDDGSKAGPKAGPNVGPKAEPKTSFRPLSR